MPQILLKLWDDSNGEVYTWMSYGKEVKKRSKVIRIKLSRWQRIVERLHLLWRT